MIFVAPTRLREVRALAVEPHVLVDEAPLQHVKDLAIQLSSQIVGDGDPEQLARTQQVFLHTPHEFRLVDMFLRQAGDLQCVVTHRTVSSFEVALELALEGGVPNRQSQQDEIQAAASVEHVLRIGRELFHVLRAAEMGQVARVLLLVELHEHWPQARQILHDEENHGGDCSRQTHQSLETVHERKPHANDEGLGQVGSVIEALRTAGSPFVHLPLCPGGESVGDGLLAAADHLGLLFGGGHGAHQQGHLLRDTLLHRVGDLVEGLGPDDPDDKAVQDDG
mmetsp:Transcript_15554/g.39534  ORF Transcript_15554/g.39534 Transcript_15554/m.39534 type:complete len:280 (-) Transcript_15554:83-922(-)